MKGQTQLDNPYPDKYIRVDSGSDAGEGESIRSVSILFTFDRQNWKEHSKQVT